jgi:DNA-binding GntR family transcriptional regulator
MTSGPKIATGDGFRTKHQFVLDALRNAIVTGDLQPGERLLAGNLAAEFHVSSMPVREALRQLEAEGLVTIRPHLGATVTRLSTSTAAEFVEIRSVLEGLASRLAADRIQPDQLSEIKRLLKRMDDSLGDTAASSKRFADANLEFHAVILDASGSTELYRILTGLHERTVRFRAQFHLVPGLAANSQRDHREIVKAIEAGDGTRAEEIAREHHLRAFRELLAYESDTQRAAGRRRRGSGDSHDGTTTADSIATAE